MIETRPSWAWLLFVQLALVIAASVLATTGHFPAAMFRTPFDKVGHLAAYGGLALLAVAFFGRRRSLRVMAALLIAATLEEISQRAFPTRTFDLGDLAMNWAGTVAGTLVARRILVRVP
jgi:VanZ family protein